MSNRLRRDTISSTPIYHWDREREDGGKMCSTRSRIGDKRDDSEGKEGTVVVENRREKDRMERKKIGRRAAMHLLDVLEPRRAVDRVHANDLPLARG